MVPGQVGRIHVELVARLLGDRLQELPDGIGHHQRELVAAEFCGRLGDRGDGVMVVDHRAVAREAAGDQLHPHHRLLGGFDQVEPAFTAVFAWHGQREPTDLADRLGDAFEQVGPIVDQPVAPVFPAGLLVGHEREHQVPRRHDPRAFEVPGDRDEHAAHVLHVDRAAAPDVAVLDRAGERDARSNPTPRRAPRRGARAAAGRRGRGWRPRAWRTRCPAPVRRLPRIGSCNRPLPAVRPPSGHIRPRLGWFRAHRCWTCRSG